MSFYILEGDVFINNQQTAQSHQLVIFENTEGKITVNAKKDSKLLLMAGAPINEPMVSYGPFVMNTETDITEAINDYRKGKMGFLD